MRQSTLTNWTGWSRLRRSEVIVSTQILNYDGAGNLLNDGEYTYTWEMGRQLQGITGTGLNTSYKYNENGLRTQKTVNGMTHEYTQLGSSVTREVIRDSQGNVLWTIHYSYAGDSTPVSMNVNGTEYYFLKNAQGDITHIVDGEGNEVASYEYDAWGNHLSVTGGDIAELNPYRYRGYRYDSETGLYYLQSRYYNPEAQRFVNADVLISTGQGLHSHNMYVYCNNNPVTFLDPTGFAAAEWFSSMWWLCLIDTALPIGDAVYFIGGFAIAIGDFFTAYPQTLDYTIAAVNQVFAKPKSRALDKTGKPNSSDYLLDEDGTIKQKRTYDDKGRAKEDIDYKHPGKNHTFPHKHEWDWSGPKPQRGPAKPMEGGLLIWEK